MYTFPFTEESVRSEICGRTMMVGLRSLGSNEVCGLKEFVLRPSTGAEGSNWSVSDGVLYLEDEKGMALHEINSLELVSGEVCLGGYPNRVAGKRAVMYEKRFLGTDFHVVVSSHVDYEGVALPRLVRSLLRVGIPEERVTVVVGGADGEPSKEKGYRRVPVKGNLLGSTAIDYLVDPNCEIGSSYVVLLHDTCEVMSDFEEKVKGMDVGLPYDVSGSFNEIGLWSMDFMRRVCKIGGFERSPIHHVPLRLVEMARLVKRCSETIERKTKDVYGSGVKRKVLEIPGMGVKKYVGRDMTGGRP